MCSVRSEQKNHVLSLTWGCSFRRVHSSILRDMSILGYLGHLQSPDIGAVLPLHSLVPYQVKELFATRNVHTAQLEVMGNSVPTAYVSQKRDKRSNLQSDCIQGVWGPGFCRVAGVARVCCVSCVCRCWCRSCSVCPAVVHGCGVGVSRILSLNSSSIHVELMSTFLFPVRYLSMLLHSGLFTRMLLPATSCTR